MWAILQVSLRIQASNVSKVLLLLRIPCQIFNGSAGLKLRACIIHAHVCESTKSGCASLCCGVGFPETAPFVGIADAGTMLWMFCDVSRADMHLTRVRQSAKDNACFSALSLKFAAHVTQKLSAIQI